MTKNNPPYLSAKKKLFTRKHFILVLILSGLILTGMTWTHPLTSRTIAGRWQVANPTTLATTTEEPDNPILTSTPTPVVSGNADETTGVILVGVILVLIVLGGTLGTTRRKL
jgi:hypothetical protein